RPVADIRHEARYTHVGARLPDSAAVVPGARRARAHRHHGPRGTVGLLPGWTLSSVADVARGGTPSCGVGRLRLVCLALAVAGRPTPGSADVPRMGRLVYASRRCLRSAPERQLRAVGRLHTQGKDFRLSLSHRPWYYVFASNADTRPRLELRGRWRG